MTDDSRSSRVGFSRILGLSATVALGLSVSFSLVLAAGIEVVMAVDAHGAAIALVLAALFYLPVLLTYAEMAARKPGSASPYQISRYYGSTSLTFFVGWLMIAGLLGAAAALCRELAIYMDVTLQSLLQVNIDRIWYLIAAVALGAVNEWLSSEDRWRSRTILVWSGLGIFIIVLVWAALVKPSGVGEMPRAEVHAHDLAKVALLAVGLWFVDLLLNHRRQIQRPDSTLRRSLLVVWFGTLILAIVTAYLVARSPSLLMEFWAPEIAWDETRLELLILAVGILFSWLGLSRLISRTVRLTGAMARHGFLPTFGTDHGPRFRALLALSILGSAVVLVAWSMPLIRIMGLSAACFLLITLLVTFPFARKPAREIPEYRRNRLPLHPLFPGLTVVICASLTLVLPRAGHGVLLIWTLLGLILYMAYARQRATSVVQEEVVVGEVDEVQTKERARILIGAGSRERLPSLITLGRAIARDMDAELIVVRVLPAVDELSLSSLQRSAEDQWAKLENLLGSLETDGVSTSSLVRIAPSVEAGILAAASEYDVDLVLMGVGDRARDAPPSAIVSRVFASTSRAMVVLRGEIDGERLDVIVGTSGGPHAPRALEFGAAIAHNTGGHLELVSVVPQAQSEEVAEEAIQRTLEKADGVGDVDHRIVSAAGVEAGLLEVAKGKLLVLGASVDRLLQRTVIDGLSFEISRVRQEATLSVKRAEAAMRFWQRRIWEFLARYTPNLTVSERSQVYSQMRHSARADADFYALISLSSAIAIFGLLLDSGAVIIGAMLVAPLMSPILAIAQGVVQGNPLLIQRAGASTFKGISVSIGVATILTAILPNILPTGEILARTSPNLLDLGVALAAGAAAAWAVSRASVAAALPGVAIAVALVPPLCVVGYGLGTSRFSIAGGAFLLFLTNLAAIIVTGALVFVLLGFRPTRAERDVEVRKAAAVAIVAVAILIVPLGLSTIQVSRQGHIESEIEEILATQTDESFRVQHVAVSHDKRGFLVEGTVFAFEGFETERIFAFQENLEQATGVRVRVQLTIVPATLTVAGEPVTDDASSESSVLPSDSQ